MAKKVAILVRDRMGEALRMAVGATLVDDEISVFIMDRNIEHNENNDLNLETLTALGVKIFSNNPANPYTQKSTEEIARILPEYDVIVPY